MPVGPNDELHRVKLVNAPSILTGSWDKATINKCIDDFIERDKRYVDSGAGYLTGEIRTPDVTSFKDAIESIGRYSKIINPAFEIVEIVPDRTQDVYTLEAIIRFLKTPAGNDLRDAFLSPALSVSFAMRCLYKSDEIKNEHSLINIITWDGNIEC